MAFLPSRDIHFVDFDWSEKIEGRRIERSGEALDTPVDRLVIHPSFVLQLSETRVKPEKRVDGEQPPAKCDFRAREDRARLVIKRAFAILTEIPLKHP